MKRALVVSIALSSLIVAGCVQEPAPPFKSQTGDATVSGSFAKAPPSTSDIPAALQNDAYHYYGLSRTTTTNYTLSIDGGPPQTGSETVTYKGMADGKAKFDIERTGALAQMGSEHVALDETGVKVESTSPGKLEGNPMAMPAKLTPGVTWKTDYKVTVTEPQPQVTEDHSTFKIVGPQKVTTSAGTFDAVLVQSEGNDKLGDKPFKLNTKSWYVKDRGPVKIVVTTTVDGKNTTLTIEAAGEEKKP